MFPGNWTHNLYAANAMLYHWATGTQVRLNTYNQLFWEKMSSLNYFKAWVSFYEEWIAPRLLNPPSRASESVWVKICSWSPVRESLRLSKPLRKEAATDTSVFIMFPEAMLFTRKIYAEKTDQVKLHEIPQVKGIIYSRDCVGWRTCNLFFKDIKG